MCNFKATYKGFKNPRGALPAAMRRSLTRPMTLAKVGLEGGVSYLFHGNKSGYSRGAGGAGDTLEGTTADNVKVDWSTVSEKATHWMY